MAAAHKGQPLQVTRLFIVLSHWHSHGGTFRRTLTYQYKLFQPYTTWMITLQLTETSTRTRRMWDPWYNIPKLEVACNFTSRFSPPILEAVRTSEILYTVLSKAVIGMVQQTPIRFDITTDKTAPLTKCRAPWNCSIDLSPPKSLETHFQSFTIGRSEAGAKLS